MIRSELCPGLVPSDLLLQGAIEAGLQDIRNNPFLLDYLFSWLINDDLTKQMYGEKEFSRAKEWFLKHKIWVTMSSRLDDFKSPLISINLQNSTEDYSTLGDVNYDTVEDVESEEVNIQPQVIAGPFTPSSYDSATGIVTLPSDISLENVFSGMILMDTTSNIGYSIEDVIEPDQIEVAEDLNANFTNAYIAPVDSFFVTSLESVLFRNTYSIKCIVQSDPVYLVYLTMIVRFILLRYKESLLEGRGFDRTTISLGAPYNAQQLTNVESTFGQDFSLTGYVREFWPKMISPKLQGIKINGLQALSGTTSPISIISEVEAQGWGLEGDFS